MNAPTPTGSRGLSAMDPDVYRRWVRTVLVVGVVGYLTGIAIGRVAEPQVWWPRVPEIAILTLAVAGLMVPSRGLTRGWALVFVGAAFLETHLFFFAYGIEGPTVVLGPAFVLGAGFLFGEFAAAWMLVLSVGIVTAAGVNAGPPGFTPREIERVVYLFVAEFATVLLTVHGLRALASTLTQAQRARRRAEDLVLHAPDGILILDRDGRIVDSNPSARSLFERTVDDLVGASFDRLRQGRGTDGLPVDWGRGTPTPVVVRVADGDGRIRVLEATSRRLPDTGAEARTQVMLRDVTARVRADQQERQLEEERRTTERLEALGVMAGGLAHDFNNLLTVIRGSAELLRLGGDDDPDELIDEILDAQSRGAALIRQLLAFARKDAGTPEARRVSADLAAQRDEIRGLLGDDRRLELDLRADGWILADERQLRHVVRQLVSNAAKAVSPGGTVTVRTEDRSGARGATGSGWVRISVVDDGVGMAPEVADRMFDPFFTTRPFGEGSGLGLATVHGIVEQAGGTIRVDSGPGRGTAVHVTWPAAPRPDEMRDPDAGPVSA